MQNLEINCFLKSPLCQTPPALDSLFGNILGIEQDSYINRNSDLSDCLKLDIPLTKEKFNDDWFYKCSNPLFHVEYEWHEYWSKRIEIEKMALKSKKISNNISTASGTYKMRYSPLLCRQIYFIKWFCVGDKIKIESILNDIKAIGNKRSIGYGFVFYWEVNKIKNDYSIFYEIEKNKYLTKTIPLSYYKKIENLGLQNIRKEYGAYRLPYWHSDNYKEVIVPC